MSSDGYFDDDLDEAAFAQLDAIEAVYTGTTSGVQTSTLTKPPPAPSLKYAPKEASFYDLTLDLDDDDYEQLDNAILDSYAGKTKTPLGPTRQTTLFGDVLSKSTPAPAKKPPLQKTASIPRNSFGSRPKKTKIWDQTAFAKSGQRKKGKGKSFADEEEEERVEFEQFPAPFVSPDGPPPPMKLKPDLLATKHWYYPLNKEKRDYQYNIVKNSLFENTIVSVPTGLGKTFIAGVIMLNYYRWFPDGKVVFVAPTKPLVSQQIEASHQSCGIPGKDATEMTGEIARAKRERLWREKRVFYMTPQTLMNDLATQNCDVMDIVLLVIDEAHKATGDYAYNQIVRWMMAKNPHFRLLALTATPGSNPEAVQDLVDGLHISHIEIRDENSIDLRPYLHEKKIEQHCIRMPLEIIRIRDSLAALIDTYLRPLKARGIMWPEQSAIKLHPYSARGKMTTLPPNQRGFIGQLSMLGNLAQAMGYLLEGTVGMAFSFLKAVSEKDSDEHASKNQQAQSKRLRDSELFKQTIGHFLAYRTTPTGPFPPHPKMDITVDLLVRYYGERLADTDTEGEGGDPGESKAMVFVTHREAVDEIVEALNSHRPLIRASKFIGQGTDKHGKRGQAQKEQLEIIQKFQAGEFNVLVATCIGEEGLDIGEVDLIICYDTQKTPIRMLQRFGRTGRKRAGCVHVLLAEDREEFNLDKARALYKEVQKSICRGEDLEFYADVKRLIPEHIKPQCVEEMMVIQPYVREESSKAKRSPTKASTTNKRKRNDDMMRNIPQGASTGFVSVAELIVKKSKKRKLVSEKTLEEDGEDDDLDRELDVGVHGLAHGKKRTYSMSPSAIRSSTWKEDGPEKQTVKGKLKRASTETAVESKPKPRRKKKDHEDEDELKKVKGIRSKGKGKAKAKQKEPSLSLSQQGRDDSLDRELEEDPLKILGKTQKLKSLSPDPELVSLRSPSLSPMYGCTTEQLSPFQEDTVMESSDEGKGPGQSGTHGTQTGLWENQGNDGNMAWLVDDDDEPDVVILSSSPVVPKSTRCDDSIELVGLKLVNQYHSSRSSVNPQTQIPDDGVLELSSEGDVYMVPSPDISSKHEGIETIPELIRPYRSSDIPAPEDTQSVRLKGRTAPKRHLVLDHPSSSAEEMSPPSLHRLRRYDDTPEHQSKRSKKNSKPFMKRKHNPLLEYSAEHSGDEVSAGSSNSDDDVESDSDRLFIKDSPMTQMSSSYDQRLAYRKGLMTQAPGDGPVFHSGPVRRGPFGRMVPKVNRRAADSSPPPDDDYEFGSFVVDNDADISYLTQADESF